MVSLEAPGTIYVVHHEAGGCIEVAGERIGVLLDPESRFIGQCSSPDGTVFAAGEDFLWIEGYFAVGLSDASIDLQNSDFSVLRNVTASDDDFSAASIVAAVRLSGAGIRVDGLQVYHSSGDCLVMGSGFTGGHVSNVTASSCEADGVDVEGSGNLLDTLRVSGCGESCVEIDGDGNRFSDLRISNAISHCVDMGVNDTTATGLLLSGCNRGLKVDGETNVVMNVTAVHNTMGIELRGPGNTVSGAVVANNDSDGIEIDSEASGSVIWNLATANNGSDGIDIRSSNNALHGLLLVGNNGGLNCRVESGPSEPGMEHSSCLGTNAVLELGTDLTDSWLGKVMFDDAVNISDLAGAAGSEDITDWTSFERVDRLWGRDGSAFPDPSNRLVCDSGESCRIWDWSLYAPETEIHNRLDVTSTGSLIVTHEWSAANPSDCAGLGLWTDDACTTTFVVHAYEPVDGAAQDHQLCDSFDTCVHTPNIGAFQGFGAFETLGRYNPGLMTDVSVIAHQFTAY